MQSRNPSMPVTVAVSQIDPVPGALRKNIDLHREQLAEAQSAGCDLLVFPELSLTGYDLRERVSEVALHDDHPELVRLTAEVGSIIVIVGCVWKQRPSVFTNSSLVLHERRVLARHDKVYLPTYGKYEEGKWFARGDRVSAIDTGIGRLGVMICEESWHVSIPYLLWLAGAQLLIIQTASSCAPSEIDDPAGSAATCRLQNRFYARMLGSFVIFANRVGEEGDFQFWGGSEIVSPAAEVIAQAGERRPQLLTCSIDFEDVRQARRRLPLLRDEDCDLTLAQLRRLCTPAKRKEASGPHGLLH